MILNFSDALAAVPLQTGRLLLETPGNAYKQLLKNLDILVGTHGAFLLGPWIESARGWGAAVVSDCHYGSAPDVTDCPHFYEWNAQVQITTWNLTMPNASSAPGGQMDCAAKHKNGLIGDYYAKGVALVLKRALSPPGTLRLEAKHAYHTGRRRSRNTQSEPLGILCDSP